MFASRIRDSDAATLTGHRLSLRNCELQPVHRSTARPWTVPRLPTALWIAVIAEAAFA
jgi:hypothetical protein